jgi:CubicO group peptidase (beta-lactamase class C family)
MRNLLRLLLALICILGGVLIFYSLNKSTHSIPTAKPTEAGFSKPRLEQLDQVVKAYVDNKELAGAVTLIARNGKLAQIQAYGMADIEARKPMQADTIFRIASMTKPITTVAIMMLFEEGKLLMTEPIEKYLPEFKEMKVLVENSSTGKDGQGYTLVPAKRPITIHHLLTHTAGFTYTFQGTHYVSDMYKNAGVSDGLTQTEGTLADEVSKLARLPLCRQPGEGFDYGLSTDVAGRIVEVISGVSLEQFFRERIFKPLAMNDTYFYLPEEKVSRLAALYQPTEKGLEKYTDDPIGTGLMRYSSSYHYKGPRTYFSGGAGLVSTAEDYWKFLQMLLNGGELNGVRLLSRKTIEFMTCNHIGDTVMWNSPFDGFRFGLGFAVKTDLGASWKIGSVGEYSWGGFFSTTFWVDPKEQLIGIVLTQLRPNDKLDLHEKFKALTYQAIAD